jgi:hypothetical protein
MSKRPSLKAPKVGSPGFVREKKGVEITQRTRKLNEKGRAFLESIHARTDLDSLMKMGRDFREFLRDAGLPSDPTEGGKYPFRSHITPELAEESYVWYVASILDNIAAWQQALICGDDHGAEILEGKAVFLFSEALHKPDVLKAGNYGAVQTKKGIESGKKRKAATEPWHENLRRDAIKIRSNRPTLPERSIANILYRDPTKPGGKLSESRIREIIKPA